MSPQSMVFGWWLSQAQVNPRRYRGSCVPKISPRGVQTFSGRRQSHKKIIMYMFSYLQKLDISKEKMFKHYFSMSKGAYPRLVSPWGRGVTSGATWPPNTPASDRLFSEIDAYAMVF